MIPVWYSYGMWLTAIGSYLLGLFVISRGLKNVLYRAWFYFCCSVGTWSLGYFFTMLPHMPKDWALVSSRISHASGAFIPAFFLRYVFIWLDIRESRGSLLRICNVLCGILTVCSFTNLIVVDVVPKLSFNFYPVGRVGYLLYIINFVFWVIVAHCYMFKNYKIMSGYKRNQMKYFLVGTSLGYFGGASCFPLIFNIRMPPYPSILIFVYSITTTYAIVRHRLLDINLAAARFAILAIVYFPVIFLPFWLGSKVIHTNLWWIPILLMGVLATLGVFIFNSLRRQAENHLLAGDLKKYAIIERFSAALSKMIDIGPDRLCKLILYRLVRIMGISRGEIYLADEDGNRCISKAVYVFRGTKIENPGELSAENSFIEFISAYRKEFLLEDLDRLSSDPLPGINYDQVIAQMRRLKAVLIIPSFLENKLFGLLVLGEKSAGRPYSKSDIEILAALSHSASLAILNSTFALKLKDKERELADKSRIIEIGNLASATGHQLGNVLNNIINFGCGILDNDAILEALKDHPKAMADFDKLVKMIITDAQDGDRIIEEIRGYSRQEGSRELSLVNLKDILDRTLGILLIQVNKFQNIDINLNINPDLPQVLVSPVGMQNIFVNMLNNSYDSIQEIKAYLQSHLETGLNGYKGRIDINISRSKDKVDIRVSDNGMGMTEDIARRLFTPNYTTKASIDKRREIKLNGGTGIGLFTIRFLLNDYGGMVKLCRTEPLKGAEFLIQLPVPKG